MTTYGLEAVRAVLPGVSPGTLNTWRARGFLDRASGRLGPKGSRYTEDDLVRLSIVADLRLRLGLERAADLARRAVEAHRRNPERPVFSAWGSSGVSGIVINVEHYRGKVRARLPTVDGTPHAVESEG